MYKIDYVNVVGQLYLCNLSAFSGPFGRDQLGRKREFPERKHLAPRKQNLACLTCLIFILIKKKKKKKKKKKPH